MVAGALRSGDALSYLSFQRCRAFEGSPAGQTVLMSSPHFVPVLVKKKKT